MLGLPLALLFASASDDAALSYLGGARSDAFFPPVRSTIPANAQIRVPRAAIEPFFDINFIIERRLADGTTSTVDFTDDPAAVDGALVLVLDVGELVPGQPLTITCSGCDLTQLEWDVDDTADETAPAFTADVPRTEVNVDARDPTPRNEVLVCLPPLSVDEGVLFSAVRDDGEPGVVTQPFDDVACSADAGEGQLFRFIARDRNDVDELCLTFTAVDAAGNFAQLPQHCLELLPREAFVARGCAQAPFEIALPALFAFGFARRRHRATRA